jgi:hypothetical protein
MMRTSAVLDLAAADRSESVALYDAQEFDLHVGADFSHFIQEEGAAIGIFQVAGPVGKGT